jgi:PhzF family phenazine biosynthesis protein
MHVKTYIVDSFTNEPFKGNPAGVCFITEELSDDTMQKIAREFGLSETAFVRTTDKTGTYSIRYFSPKREIPLCGHATLASAKVLFQNKDLDELHFITVENIDLAVRRINDEITMEFPVYDTISAEAPAEMLKALGLEKVNNTAFSPKNNILLLEISDAGLLAGLNPDYTALLKTHDKINGVLVTAPSNNGDAHFHYRYFWPWAGTNEDPVTGGVQTFLAKYWAKKLDKSKMKAFQSSGRTGSMTVELKGEKVFLTSQAVIIMEGNLIAY